MKTFLKTIAFMLVLTGVFACSPDEDLTPQSLEVTPNNISGVWKLADVNGEALPQGIYCYIEFVRRDRTFAMYQKFDSMYARCITGEFQLEEDDTWGSIISGTYDYGMGSWNNEYIITDLLEEGSMTWIVKGDESDVCVYCRCDEVPVEVIAESKSEE